MIETGSLSPTESRILLSHTPNKLITPPCSTARIPFFQILPGKNDPTFAIHGEKNPLGLWRGRLSDPHYPITGSIEICMAIERGADRSPLARDRVN